MYLEQRIIFALPSLEVGGAEIVALEIATELSSRGYPVEILVISRASRNTLSTSLKVTCLNSKRVGTSIVGLLRFLRRNRDSIIFSSISHLNISLLLCNFLLMKKSVILPVEVGLKATREIYGSLGNFLFRKLFRLTYNHLTTTAIAVSPIIRAELAEVYGIPSDRVTLIRNPVRQMKSEFGATIDISEHSPPYFFCIGRLEPIKNFDVAVKAFCLAVQRGLQGHLFIVGEGSQMNNLREIASEYGVLDSHISFLGFIFDMSSVYSVADFVILSSESEGDGLVASEALAFGISVICSDLPAYRYQVKEFEMDGNAFFFESGNTLELVKILNSVGSQQVFRSPRTQRETTRQVSAITNQYILLAQKSVVAG